jgi:hypothetical protein
VNAADLVEGETFALREGSSGAAATPVLAVGPKPRSGKVKVKRLDGDHEGLEEWVPTRYVVCRWEDLQSFLHDEQAEVALRADMDENCDKVMSDAIECVMESTGEKTSFWHGWTEDPPVIKRLWARAGLDGNPLRHHHLAYQDRSRRWHLPYETALAFAVAFSRAESETVLMHVAEQEREMRSRGYQPGEGTWHKILAEYRPAYAIVREWAGVRDDVTRLTKEVERLHGLIDQAEWALRHVGADADANRLRRALNGG